MKPFILHPSPFILMKTILFVCTANICRSPMAAALMRARLAELGLGDQIEVLSAGVWAEAGQPASEDAAATLGKRGVSLAEHRSQPATLALLQQAAIVLVMEETHRRSLFYLAPQYLNKVFLLTEMSGRHSDVADPYGGPIEGYERTATRLKDLIEAGLPQILKRVGVKRAGE
jgi:protein-tyrosine phosphatase